MASKSADSILDNGERKYVLSVDIGSTSMRCFVIDKDLKFVGKAAQPMEYTRPQQGHVELDPELIWERFVTIIKEAMETAKITASQVSSLGISLARGTFTSWDRETGEIVHPFISWQDTRSAPLAKSWNNSLMFKAISKASRAIYTVTRIRRFLAMSVIEFKSLHMCIRAQWVLDNIPRARELADAGQLMFGTLDTFLLWRLSGGKVHATDASNASATAIYDAYTTSWSSTVCKLMNIPLNSLPVIVDTSTHICTSEDEIFGGPIEVHAVAADQQSSLFGQACWEDRELKLTLGSGSFLDVRTVTPHASPSGIYPMVAWQINGEVSFMAEGVAISTGHCVEWASKVGWFENVADTSRMAESVEDSGGVCFVPAIAGLEAPINDPTACCSVLGIKPDTRREHLVRAMLESFAFRASQILDRAQEEIGNLPDCVRVDGGVSENNFLLQTIADLTSCKIQRAAVRETTALGVAFFAGLSSGLWASRDEIKEKVIFTDIFVPNPENKARLLEARELWSKAVGRSLKWYRY
ncbi:putative glycerol kinase 5 isoform X1 [Sycon ciliatum]|uniref:putative glycerol kinase 5 isoform X1 n=2 Tax=Sycon ciliatum TaxID=27933 RepID=UPI0031F6269F